MLATANRSRVLLFVTKKLTWAGGVVEPVKIFLLSSLITMQNLLCVILCMGAYIGGPKNLWVLE